MNKRASEEIKNQATELYNKGLSAQAIANKIGYNEETVRGWLKRKGISIRNGGFYNKKYSMELFYEIKRLYEIGKYTTEIDEILNLII